MHECAMSEGYTTQTTFSGLSEKSANILGLFSQRRNSISTNILSRVGDAFVIYLNDVCLLTPLVQILIDEIIDEMMLTWSAKFALSTTGFAE